MILVVGATGTLGSRIVHGLLEQGKNVRVLVRHDPISAAMAAQGLAHAPESVIEAGAAQDHPVASCGAKRPSQVHEIC